MRHATWSKPGLDRLDEVVARHVGPGGVQGAAWLVARGGEVHVGTAGTLDGGSTPVRRDSIFRIASMSKPVTAAAVLALIEDCTVRLEDPLETWLPELAGIRVLRDPGGPLDDTVAAVRPPTVHDALTFRLGWGMDFANWDGQILLGAMTEALGLEVGPPRPTKTPPPDEFIEICGRFPLEYQPGERWLYNTGSDLLGILVARASGQSFGDFLQQRIFGPLGMVDTGFSVPAGSLHRFGPSFLPPAGSEGDRPAVFDPTDGEWAAPPPFESGGGGLVSTLDDYAAFAQALLDGGGPILSRASVAAMTTDHLYAPDGTLQGGPDPTGALGWGFGVGVLRRRIGVAESPGTYAWAGGMGTSWANDPVEGVVGILLTNQLFSSPALPPIHQDFWTSTYTALP